MLPACSIAVTGVVRTRAAQSRLATLLNGAAAQNTFPRNRLAPSLRALSAAAGGMPPVEQAPGAGASASAGAPAARGAPGLVGLSGAPIATRTGDDAQLGPEIDLTAENAAQILQRPGAILLQVGDPGDAVTKKINQLRSSASGRLPVARLDCGKLPQICQALQIASDPAILLMAKGQVAAALENDLSPQATTAFAEKVAQMLGLKVDLSQGTTEQLAEAEDLERNDATAADDMFIAVGEAEDLTMEARIRASAGRARCALRLGHRDQAEPVLKEIESSGRGRTPEVKQAMAMLHLDELRVADQADPEPLREAAETKPVDPSAVCAYSISLFWAGQEEKAVEVAIVAVRTKEGRTPEVRKIALSLVEALGPRHPKTKAYRKQLNNAFFI